MSERKPNPDRHEGVTRLKNPDTGETEEVVALLGFVGDGRDGHVRLYPDLAYQRWMDIPPGDILDSERLAGDVHGRTVVYVKTAELNKPLFRDDTIEALSARFAGPWISTWALIPATKYVAADVLDLIAPWAGDEDEGGY